VLLASLVVTASLAIWSQPASAQDGEDAQGSGNTTDVGSLDECRTSEITALEGAVESELTEWDAAMDAELAELEAANEADPAPYEEEAVEPDAVAVEAELAADVTALDQAVGAEITTLDAIVASMDPIVLERCATDADVPGVPGLDSVIPETGFGPDGFRSNGCSWSPDRSWYPVYYDFYNACWWHDHCYHYHPFGGDSRGRKACDDRFLRHMDNWCDCQYHRWWQRATRYVCHRVADIYYGAVRRWGGPRFYH
jgi:hypothetical protein